MTRFLFCIVVALVTLGCEEQPIIIPTSGGVDPVDSNTVFKTVLLEDMTGVRCPNCPKGSAAVKEIQQIYGEDRVIAIGVHGAFLAEPTNESKYDFRNFHSETVEVDIFGDDVIGKPAASFNRLPLQEAGGSLVSLDSDEWPILAERELQVPAQAIVEIQHSYDDVTRAVEMTAITTGISDINNGVAISVFFTQSKIIDKQETVGAIIPDYEHNHILIGGATSPFGDPLVQSLAADQVVERSFSYTLPAEDGLWKADDMDIVAFIHSAGGTTQEVYYATHAPLVE